MMSCRKLQQLLVIVVEESNFTLNDKYLGQKYDNVKLDLQMRYANENCTK